MKNSLLFLTIINLLFLLTSCEFNRSLEGESVNFNSDKSRTSNYEKYDDFYIYSAFVDYPDSQDTTGSYVSPLALASNKVVLTNRNGKVMLLTGKHIEWEAKLDSNAMPMSAMCADQKQNIYVIANNGVLYSFSFTGDLRWKKYFRHSEKKRLVFSDLLILENAILVGSNKGLLAKIDFNGNTIWEKHFSTSISRTFAADDKENIALPLTHNSYGETDTLLFLNPSGERIWIWSHENFRIIRYPVISNDIIYIAGVKDSENDRVNLAFAINKNDGEILWKVDLKAVPRYISADSKNRLYVISYNLGIAMPITIINCFSENGEYIWEKFYESVAYSPLLISRKYLAFAGMTFNTEGVYFMKKNGDFIKTVSLSNLPGVVMKPDVKPDAVMIFAGSTRLSIIRIDEIWINKIIPW